MNKTKNNLAQVILDVEKGKIAYESGEINDPLYYKNKINIMDEVNSEKFGTWKKTKEHMKKLYASSGCSSLFFVAHKEDEIIGKPQLIEEYRKKIVLSVKTKKRIAGGDLEVNYVFKKKFLDDNLNRRDDGEEIEDCSLWFWIYKIVDDDKEYILLCDKQLTPNLYRFRGMKITLKDNSEITKTLNFKSLTNVFIAVEEKPAINVLEKANLINYFKDLKERYNLDDKRFNEYLFTNENGKIYTHTENYSKVIMSWLFSGKYEGYPLHLLIFGPAGCGKTTGLECINRIFDEDKGIFEAGNSTLKGLIPSFRERPAKVGYILDCVRLGLIDELFKMIEGVETGKYLELLTNYFSKLNMLLEHKERTIGSGTDTLKAKATAKLLLMTNPYKKKRTIEEHIEIMDVTTLSRFIPLVQDHEERA